VVGNQRVKVRLAGIDAPELDQAYGQKAKRALSALAFGKKARAESPAPDKYGRTLGTVWVGGAERERGMGLSRLSVSAGTGGSGGASAGGQTGLVGVAGGPALSAVGLAA